jgi:hypothetical protein
MRDRKKIEELSKEIGKEPLRIEDIRLLGWQQAVVDAVEKHDDSRDSEDWVGHPEYKLNKELGVTIAMPRGSGHTLLANYLASKYPSLLIYGDIEHYRKVTGYFGLHQNTETVSVYEIFYSVFRPSQMIPSPEFANIKRRFENKKVIILDNALSVQENIKDVIYNTARGAVVFLGY